MAAILFTARLEVLNVFELDPVAERRVWRVEAEVADNSAAAFSGFDVAVGQYIFCYSFFGDVDVFKIIDISIQDIVAVAFDVVYAEDGDPRIDMPSPGTSAICAPILADSVLAVVAVPNYYLNMIPIEVYNAIVGWNAKQGSKASEISNDSGITGPTVAAALAGTDARHTYTQPFMNVAAVEVTHNLGKHPAVVVTTVDGLAREVAVTYVDNNVLWVRMSEAESGVVSCS